MPDINERDPYTPPPMHHDRSGPVLRVALLAGMLALAGMGYAWMQSQPQTALVPEIAEEQQVADAGYQVEPEIPVAAPEPTSVAPAPQTRRSAPAQRAPAPAPVEASPEPAPSGTV
jgi:hypothetical protein